MGEIRVLRLAAAATVAALLFAGCGDDSTEAGGSLTSAPTGDDDQATPEGSTDTAAPDDVGSTDTDTDPDDGTASSGSDLAPGTGFIQIGELRHDLTIELCANVFDAVNGRAVSASDPDGVTVVFNISPEDWQERGENFGYEDAGSVQYIESQTPSWSTGLGYMGDYEIPADIDTSTLGISSYEISDDGQSVAGEATFYDLNALVYATPVAPASGRFAFACPTG